MEFSWGFEVIFVCHPPPKTELPVSFQLISARPMYKFEVLHQARVMPVLAASLLHDSPSMQATTLLYFFHLLSTRRSMLLYLLS